MNPLVSRSNEEYDYLHSNVLSQLLLHHCGCATLPGSIAAITGSDINQPSYSLGTTQPSLAVVEHPV